MSQVTGDDGQRPEAPSRGPLSLSTLSENLQHHRTAAVLSILGLMAVGGFIALMVTRTPAGQNTLWLDVAQGLVTLVIVGILGTVLKLLADDYQAKRLRQEKQSEFWVDKYRRLVQITNKLHRISHLVPVDWSEDLLRKCLFDITDVSAELQVIKQEIWVSSGVLDSPFPNPKLVTEKLERKLERMYAYTEALAGEFDQALSEAHAADGENSAQARLKELPKSQDLLKVAGRKDAENTPKSWDDYLHNETEVLKLLTEAVLGQHLSSS
jgi:hypothetical protein